MKLSDHFTLEEFTRSDTATEKRIANTITAEAAANIALLVSHVLEPARREFGKPIIISSGYRSSRLNKAVGGVTNSQHLTGQAADLQVSPISGLRTLFTILAGMDIDQLLFERNSKGVVWIHVSYNAAGNRGHINDNYQAK